MQRCGATYGPDPQRPLTHVCIHLSTNEPLLAAAAPSLTNLLPVDFIALDHAAALSPVEYHHSQALSSYPTPHFNAGQRARTEELHRDLCHPSDRSLATNLSTGNPTAC